MLLYLAENFDPGHTLLPADPAKRMEVLSWLFWQVVSLLLALHCFAGLSQPAVQLPANG